ncbi:hypothetical protein [Ponticaulis sp.]|uniref:hypothetical protein n=1 Tax=Ponticaulis sp. TaxID=2020902 RepID=UPI000B705609|nr:hypothetical protein [Ponticaulis sp.]MAI90118.1 hypothetical protein [Ponticaulis sp.]OUX99773.1 MAG: hypothetical protein CBB65_06735 [Hyphomonadaceae bacterium TMED5]|tara:strand:- start:77053 stop:77475 length:423 start_codon:yes stop_codon:yes gene_type:complete
MTFHEKSAWAMGILLTVIGGWYLKTIWDISIKLGETAPPVLALASVATIALIIGAIITHTLIGITDPEGSNDSEDERDKQVLRRSGNIAGYVLGFGCFAGLWHYVLQQDGDLLFHIIVGSLIASQIAEYVLTILFYRRGV